MAFQNRNPERGGGPDSNPWRARKGEGKRLKANTCWAFTSHQTWPKCCCILLQLCQGPLWRRCHYARGIRKSERSNGLPGVKQLIKGRAGTRTPKHDCFWRHHCSLWDTPEWPPHTGTCLVSLLRCQWPRVLKDCPSSRTNSHSCSLPRQAKAPSRPLECPCTVTSPRRPLRAAWGWWARTAPRALSPRRRPAAGPTVPAWATPGGRSGSERRPRLCPPAPPRPFAGAGARREGSLRTEVFTPHPNDCCWYSVKKKKKKRLIHTLAG